MACELTQGYSIDCRDAIGGIKSVYISNFDNVSAYTATAGEITAITQVTGKSFYKYNLEKENGAFTETQTGSLENGTNFYEGQLTFTVKKLDYTQIQELKLLALSRLWIIVEDNNGQYFSMGADFGADMLSSTNATGQAFGDLAGSSLTFSSKEKEPMFEVDSTVVAGLTQA